MRDMTGMILHTTWGYNCTRNRFLQVVKETAKTVQVVELENRSHGPRYWEGTQTPIVLTPAQVKALPKDKLFRIKKHKHDLPGELKFWGDDEIWHVWDGKPKDFNSD